MIDDSGSSGEQTPSAAEASGSACPLSECADAGQRVDILVFVRGSARPLGPRGAKVGGGIWASWVGGAGRLREASELWWRGAGVEGGLRAPACVGDGDGASEERANVRGRLWPRSLPRCGDC